eukprot:282493-Chlamydomonas_euryale.AAC.2
MARTNGPHQQPTPTSCGPVLHAAQEVHAGEWPSHRGRHQSDPRQGVATALTAYGTGRRQGKQVIQDEGWQRRYLFLEQEGAGEVGIKARPSCARHAMSTTRCSSCKHHACHPRHAFHANTTHATHAMQPMHRHAAHAPHARTKQCQVPRASTMPFHAFPRMHTTMHRTAHSACSTMPSPPPSAQP